MKSPQLKLRFYGDPCLRKKSAKVAEVGPSERILIKAMLEMMYEQKGIGLAAPQVGINQQIFVADIGTGPIVVINPRILKRRGRETLEEGCLSIPEVLVNVRRPKEIVVKFVDENNRVVEREYLDLMARVFLHETDHLNGKLIVDYAGILKKAKFRKQLKEISELNKES